MSILLTGFGPFPRVPRNPTQFIVERFPDELAGVTIHRAVLPTIYEVAERMIEELLLAHRPEFCLCLGVAGPGVPRLETTARNHGASNARDHAGAARTGPVAPSGPDTYPSTLPLAAIDAALGDRGIAFEYSDDAGGYVCNHIFYASRHAIERHGLAIRCGFVHVPEFRSPGEEDEEIGEMIGAVQTIVEVLIEAP